MTLKIARFATLVLLALVAGVFWGPWLGLSRSMHTFPPETFLTIGQTMIGNLAPVMPILVVLATIAQLVLMWQLHANHSRTFLLTVIAFGLFVVAVLVTLMVEVPIDNQIKSWTPQTLPVDWAMLRDRWETFHVIRTFSALAGLIVLVAAMVFGESRGPWTASSTSLNEPSAR